jgi:type II secretory pathway pseudopilin PulG
MIIRSNKRPFTLFEILIVIALITVALGVMTLQIPKALKGAKFERGVERIIAKLALAQEVMLDFRTDVYLTFKQQEGVMECTLTAGRKLPPRLEESLNRYKKIEGIEAVAFDTSAGGDVPQLYFDGAVGATPQGILTLSGYGREEKIVLNGYPAQIKRGTYVQANERTIDYPEEIFSAL